MKKFRPWLVILLVFVAGFAAGIVATRIAVRLFVRSTVSNPDRVGQVIERRLVERLSLEPAQRQKVHQILKERQADLRELRTEFGPRFSIIVSNAETQISETLTPEQREKFEKLREENRNFWHLPPMGRKPPPR